MAFLGSALGSLGQPTPSGNGPMGYFFATDNALVLTEKVVKMYLQVTMANQRNSLSGPSISFRFWPLVL